MSEGKGLKSIRKGYKDDGDFLTFAYCNKTYSCQTVSLVNMLFEEILKDFPKQSADNVCIKMLSDFPYTILLQFSYPKREVKHLDLSQFEENPDDFEV